MIWRAAHGSQVGKDEQLTLAWCTVRPTRVIFTWAGKGTGSVLCKSHPIKDVIVPIGPCTDAILKVTATFLWADSCLEADVIDGDVALVFTADGGLKNNLGM